MARPKQPATKARWNRVPIGQELTSAQLAGAVGVTQRYITYICQGKRPAFPFPANVRKIGASVYLITRIPNDADRPELEYDPLQDWT